jgi:hypothetical protein
MVVNQVMVQDPDVPLIITETQRVPVGLNGRGSTPPIRE